MWSVHARLAQVDLVATARVFSLKLTFCLYTPSAAPGKHLEALSASLILPSTERLRSAIDHEALDHPYEAFFRSLAIYESLGLPRCLSDIPAA